MAKPPVTLRNIKGSPLSWAEGDANFTALQAASVPDGGTPGQVLTKSSNTNYDYNWTSLQEINLQSVSSNLLPTTDLAYDLGSPTKRWRSLYVGLQTIYIDQYALSVSQGQLTIDGNTQIGPPGSQGTQGLQGTQGYQGIQGVQGTTGSQGVQGIQGIQGTQGFQGTTGSQGVQGIQGIQGVQGTIGAQGIQGVQGTIGLQGALGQQGLQGTVGDQGTQGIQGIQGEQGLQGTQGTQGTTGAQGVTGQQGIQGTTGYSSNLFFYKINAAATSGYPGDSNIIYNNATQTSSTQLLVSHLDDLNTDVDIYLSTITAGEQIIIQDRNASANYQNWLVTGTPTLTNAGQSTAYWTYPVSLASSGGTGTTGFANNHTVFLGLVSGAQGVQGLSGSAGAQGTQGVQGIQGTTGITGNQGIQGVQGITGTSGTSSLVFDYAIDTDTSTGDPGTGLISYNVIGGNTRTPVSITNQNSPVIINTSKFGTGSLNPSAGYIQTTPPSLSNAQNLTIEMWLYFTSGANQTFYDEATGPNQNCYSLGLNNGNIIVFWGGNTRITGGGINLNQWTHIAVVSNLSDYNVKLFINGVQSGSTFGVPLGSIRLFQAAIGSNFSGYIDEVRGSTIARYTSNFTPSTSAFTNDANTGLLLHFDGANGSSVFTDDAGSSQIDATELYINKTTSNNQSATNYLALLASTSRFIIQDTANASNQQTWRITGTPTNNTNHYTIPVSIQSHSGTGTTNFADALTVKLALQPSVQGIQGTSGSTGVQGTTGAQGTEGSAGSQGIQGVQGSTGTTGITGNQGIQGIQGIGEPGTQGIQGVQGATGSQGIQGIQGAQGVQGTTGTFDFSQADGGTASASFLVQANLNGGNAISN